MNKIKTADSLTIGFALFAMFFGAGNLIFPPFLGWESGGSWLIGFLCFIFIDIGMSLFAMLAIAGNGSGAEGLTGKLGNKISTVVLALNCLCIGPCRKVHGAGDVYRVIGTDRKGHRNAFG